MNPDYKNVYSFTNDFPALRLDGEPIPAEPVTDSICIASRLMKVEAEAGYGESAVLPSQPQPFALLHDGSPIMKLVVDAWAKEMTELGGMPEINYVQIFENRGAMMGSSLAAPALARSGQPQHVPDEPALEGAAQLEYQARSMGAACSATILRKS